MEDIRDIRELLFGKRTESRIFSATCLSSQGSTCTIQYGEMEIDDVRLMIDVDVNGNEYIVVPTDGTNVLVADLHGNFQNLVVVKVQQPSSISYKIDEASLKMDSEGFIIANKNENLQEILTDFMSEIQKIVVVIGVSPNIGAIEKIKQRLKKVLC